MFSKACEYGIRASVFIAQNSEKDIRVSLKEIANATDSPVAFTAKILQKLAKNDILVSTTGPAGGFQIENHLLHKITLLQIVEAIDGDTVYNGCGLGLKECNAKDPCPVHNHFISIRNDLKKMLQTTKLTELSNGLKNGLSVLKR